MPNLTMLLITAVSFLQNYLYQLLWIRQDQQFHCGTMQKSAMTSVSKQESLWKLSGALRHAQSHQCFATFSAFLDVSQVVTNQSFMEHNLMRKYLAKKSANLSLCWKELRQYPHRWKATRPKHLQCILEDEIPFERLLVKLLDTDIVCFYLLFTWLARNLHRLKLNITLFSFQWLDLWSTPSNLSASSSVAPNCRRAATL